ncbi:Hint domain-containing protein [Paracoccus cavernae]|uniref:Hint domain-containing protein n=1 Tax=Paracoccus cavernae TaxID=1571207 RepID=UPI003633384C
MTSADGRSVPVKWIGRKLITNHVMLSDKAAPVRVAAGALGGGLPHSDLLLSADHGLIVAGMVVNAGALVNGGTICFVDLADMPSEFTYYHIETEAHDEILANGLRAETLVDYIGRKGFDNYAEYLDLYGCDRIIPEMKRLRIASRRQLPSALRDQLGIAAFSDGVEAQIEAFGKAA